MHHNLVSEDLVIVPKDFALRPNSWTISQSKVEFSSLLFTQPVTVSRVLLMYTVKEKRGKPGKNPYPLPYVLRNPYRNLKSENSQDYA
jgi:hypothetical protein